MTSTKRVVQLGALVASLIATSALADVPITPWPSPFGTNTAADGGTGGGTSAAVLAATNLEFFGDGSDGPLVCAGAMSLSRDMYYTTGTISAGCAVTIYSLVSVNTAYRLFFNGNLDLTACPAGGIVANGFNGNSSVVNAIAAATSLITTTFGIGGTLVGAASPAGGTNGGTQGTAAGQLTIGAGGGTAGASGAGGLGTSGAGGLSRPLNTPLTIIRFRRPAIEVRQGNAAVNGGSSGSSGGSGGGDGTAGGGGGGGASGGGAVFISAHTISRGAGTAAGCIKAVGGTGGNGGTPAAGQRGGGGGGGGAAGGFVVIIHGGLTGATATNAVDVSGGVGGNGGNGTGAGGVGGNGGQGGGGGAIEIFDLYAGTRTGVAALTTAGTVPTAASGNTGATGGAAITSRSDL